MELGASPDASELVVRKAKLRGRQPFPTWNGTLAAPSSGPAGLCSLLSDSGEVVVLSIALDTGDQPGRPVLWQFGCECPTNLPATQWFKDSVEVQRVLSPPAQRVDSLAQCWSTDGRYLAVAFDRRVVVYKAPALTESATFELRYSVGSLGFVRCQSAGDSGHLLVIGTAFGAELYHVEVDDSTSQSTGNAIEPIASAYAGVAVALVQVSPSGRFVAIGTVDGRVFVHDLGGHAPETIATFGSEVLSKLLPTPRVTALAFSPSGSHLAVATRKGNVFVFVQSLSDGRWRRHKPTEHLGENPKSGNSYNAKTSSAASTQTMVAWWGSTDEASVIAVCSRSAASRFELVDFASGKLLHSLAFAADGAKTDQTSSEASSEWEEPPLLTGVCAVPVAKGGTSRRTFVCFDAAQNLLAVDWPLLARLSS